LRDACQGGRIPQYVAPHLRAASHNVSAPALTGRIGHRGTDPLTRVAKSDWSAMLL
jgi:hypothetical protein